MTAVDEGQIALGDFSGEISGSSPADGLTSLPVAAVARRLGVAPATLRTWDRRYGLGPSERRAGSHRRYTASDVHRLMRMRRLLTEGVAPVEAARAVLSDTSPTTPLEASHERAAAMPARSARRTPARVTAARVSGLMRAATALDAPACVGILRSDLAAYGVVTWWNRLVAPALNQLGDRICVAGEGIEIEHLLTETILSVINGAAGDPVADGPVILLASAQDDAHTLPVHVLALALRERGIAVRVLGGRTPHAALTAAVRRCGPAAVFVWSATESTAEPHQLGAMRAQRPAPHIFVGGPGWVGKALPAGVSYVSTLEHALAELSVNTGLFAPSKEQLATT